MSIPSIAKKIKQWLFGVQEEGILVLIILFVGIASFGVGRLSVNPEESPGQVAILGTVLPYEASDSSSQVSGMYVASRNGTKYYPSDCGGAKRIHDENKVWFQNQAEAEAAGFSQSSTCSY